MTGLLIMLTLATTAAPTSANLEQVLVLKAGAAMTVQSYAVDGPVIRIVGMTGEALLVRTEQADLEASGVATTRHRERSAESRSAPAVESESPVLASTRIRSDSVVDASRRALARGGRSAMSTTHSTVAVGDPVEASAEESVEESGEESALESAVEPAEKAVMPGVAAVGTIGKYELAAGASQSITLVGATAMVFGFRTQLDAEALAACKANGVRLSDARTGGATVSSKTGATLTAAPTEGVVKLTVANLEKFPIAVEVYRR